MTAKMRTMDHLRAIAKHLTLVSMTILAGLTITSAQSIGPYFDPGNLVISRSVYDNDPNNVTVGQLLPPGCQMTQGGCAGNATNDGTYPYVWNNDLVDGSFGITSKILLDQFTVAGTLVNTLEIPNFKGTEGAPAADYLVTSFSSKSELGLNSSLDGRFLTLMGYVRPLMRSTYRIPTRPRSWIRPTRLERISIGLWGLSMVRTR